MTDTHTQTTSAGAPNAAFDNIPEQFVPLDALGVAPENLRAAEGPDDDIAQLAETLFVGGQVFPLLVRPGRGKTEKPFMALDGRRRRFGFLALAEAGRVAANHPVRVKVLTDPALQVAAAMLPNTEQLAPDLVDVIGAVGRLQKRKMSPAEIARALGYTLKEVQGWGVLADLDRTVLTGLRDGRITLKQAKLMTRLDAEEQRQLAEQARAYGHLYDHVIRQRIEGAVVTVADRRVRLVGLDGYVAKGGRVESDLFGELPDTLLDQPILQAAWDEAVKPVIVALQAAGLAVFTGGVRGQAPEGYRPLPFVYADERPEVADLDALEAAAVKARAALESREALGPEAEADLLIAIACELAHLKALHTLTIGAVTVLPHGRRGVELVFHAIEAPEPEVEDDEEGLEPDEEAETVTGSRRCGDVEIPRVELDTSVSTHALNERYTDIATRGLVRALADDAPAALILVVARLFASVALSGSADKTQTISTLAAEPYRRYGVEPIAALDGDVVHRLEAHRQAYLASGQRPIPWVAGLSHGERMALLAELAAMTLNGREFATHAARHGARAEAQELTELTGYDIVNHWAPDVGFFAAHNKRQLLSMTETMGADVAPAAALKKDDLAAYVTEAAAERRWAPDALSWRRTVKIDDEAPADEAPEVVEEVPAAA